MVRSPPVPPIPNYVRRCTISGAIIRAIAKRYQPHREVNGGSTVTTSSSRWIRLCLEEDRYQYIGASYAMLVILWDIVEEHQSCLMQQYREKKTLKPKLIDLPAS